VRVLWSVSCNWEPRFLEEQRDCPLFTYGVDGLLDLAESIPFDERIAERDNKDEADQDQSRGQSNVDQWTANDIDDRGVDIIAEIDRPDCWHWELSGGEGSSDLVLISPLTR